MSKLVWNIIILSVFVVADNCQIDRNGFLYKGKCINGKANGYGQMISNEKNLYDFYEKYDGQFKNGKPHGQGKFQYSKNSFYEGQFQNGESHGKGVFVFEYANKVYRGEFKNGYRHGLGSTTIDGKLFEKGEFDRNALKKGLKHMYSGSKYKYSGSIYKGEFFDGYPSEVGTAKYVNGDTYSGQWRGGNCHGKGMYIRNNGRVIEGTFYFGDYVYNNQIKIKGLCDKEKFWRGE